MKNYPKNTRRETRRREAEKEIEGHKEALREEAKMFNEIEEIFSEFLYRAIAGKYAIKIEKENAIKWISYKRDKPPKVVVENLGENTPIEDTAPEVLDLPMEEIETKLEKGLKENYIDLIPYEDVPKKIRLI